MSMDIRPAEWTATDSQDNATATATKSAAGAGRLHVITAVVASYGAAKTGLLTVKHGTTTVLEAYVVNSAVIPIPTGLRNTNANEAVSAELAASGTGGVLGKVALLGYTL